MFLFWKGGCFFGFCVGGDGSCLVTLKFGCVGFCLVMVWGGWRALRRGLGCWSFLGEAFGWLCGGGGGGGDDGGVCPEGFVSGAEEGLAAPVHQKRVHH